jgi:hypothetical protein
MLAKKLENRGFEISKSLIVPPIQGLFMESFAFGAF